jgi:CRP-like cAMP-binding protein
MKILLASPSPTARKIIRGILEKAGCPPEEVLETPEPREIFAAIKSAAGTLELAIVDWDLPELDASALARYLRASPNRVGLLFCIRRGDDAAIAEISRLGPYDWIERPFTDAAFQKKVGAFRKAVKKAKTTDGAGRLRAIASGNVPEFALPFLLQLPSNLIEDLLRKSTRRRFAAGTVLLKANEVPEALHLVTRGEVEILEGRAGIRSRVSGEGDPYGELAFMTGRASEETVRARTQVDVASVSKAELADVLRRTPRMADYLSSLLSRHSKAMSARATTLSHADFKGTLDATPFADLIQLLGSTRKTGILGFRDEARAGAIYLEDGEAVHAWTDTLKGEEAFFELAGWKTARFAFRSIRRQEPRTLQKPTMLLLVEAMRRMEGRSRDATPSPGAAAPGR